MNFSSPEWINNIVCTVWLNRGIVACMITDAENFTSLDQLLYTHYTYLFVFNFLVDIYIHKVRILFEMISPQHVEHL